MELRHLRYFVAVAEQGNVSRAARKLFIAQPPLSAQLKQLEEEVGAALFTRDRKSTRLNSSHANISYAVFCLKKKKTASHTCTVEQFRLHARRCRVLQSYDGLHPHCGPPVRERPWRRH